MRVQIFTDGSIIKNPGGAGGWAAVHVSGEGESQRHHITSGSEYDTSNNRMEMRAAIEGIRSHPITRQIRLVSDSEYLIKGFTEGRVEKWAANNWTRKRHSDYQADGYGHRPKNTTGRPGDANRIPNADLWMDLNDLDISRPIEWVHQRGEHRRSDSLGGTEKYAALAHEIALSEARIAHWVREKHMEGLDTPESLEERTALTGLLKQLPNPPDPPPYDRFECFAVYQRVGSPRNLLFRGPIYIPMSPSMCEDTDGVKDRGRWECQKAATTMSETDATKEAQRYRDWRIPRYEVLREGIIPSEVKKQTGAAYYQFTKEQLEQLRREAGKDDRTLRAIPGGGAGGRIRGSVRVG